MMPLSELEMLHVERSADKIQDINRNIQEIIRKTKEIIDNQPKFFSEYLVENNEAA